MAQNNCVVQAEYLCTFNTFNKWVNHAASWTGGHRKGEVFCLDKNGNFCHIGEDFMAADKNDLFPVRAFRKIRTIEAVHTKVEPA